MALRDDPTPGAVLEIPLQWSTGGGVLGDQEQGTALVAAAIVHHRPVVGGSVSRYPASRLDRLTAIPAYRQLLGLCGDPAFTDAPSFTASDLDTLGIRFVVTHQDLPAPAATAYLGTLGLQPFAGDGTITVWKVPGVGS